MDKLKTTYKYTLDTDVIFKIGFVLFVTLTVILLINKQMK